MRHRLPEFLIVGVARCGTTSLFHYLKQHPQIGFPAIKEPKYFSSKCIQFPQKGIGDNTVDDKMIKEFHSYQQLFHSLDRFQVIGEASSDYFYYHKCTIPAIKKTLGDIPIIISIRNPIDRSFSAYNNLIRDGREYLSFSKALNAEQKRINEGWDWMWHYKQASLYSEGIKAFKKDFSKVKVVLFDDLTTAEDVLQKITDFLSVDRYYDFDTDIKYSPSGKAKNPVIKLFSSRKNPVVNFLRTQLIEIAGRDRVEEVAKNFFTKEEITHSVKVQLYNYFKRDIAEVEKLINQDLKAWKL